MAKGPLLTRTEIRKLKEQQAKDSKLANQEYKAKQAEIDKAFKKENKKVKIIEKSRVRETKKTKERAHTLNIAIAIVAILLLILFYIVFNF